MNLDIQLAWCRHWVRERLGLCPNSSLVLFVADRRFGQGATSRALLDAVRSVSTESRWQFSKPQCILVSIVEAPAHRSASLETSLYGIVDQQVSVDNASDLCGWMGAANTLFILGHATDSSDQLATLKSESPSEVWRLQEAMSKVCRGFGKPWNWIDRKHPQESIANLDWERIHQPLVVHGGQGFASIAFSEAVDWLELGFSSESLEDNRRGVDKPDYRRAG